MQQYWLANARATIGSHENKRNKMHVLLLVFKGFCTVFKIGTNLSCSFWGNAAQPLLIDNFYGSVVVKNVGRKTCCCCFFILKPNCLKTQQKYIGSGWILKPIKTNACSILKLRPSTVAFAHNLISRNRIKSLNLPLSSLVQIRRLCDLGRNALNT